MLNTVADQVVKYNSKAKVINEHMIALQVGIFLDCVFDLAKLHVLFKEVKDLVQLFKHVDFLLVRSKFTLVDFIHF